MFIVTLIPDLIPRGYSFCLILMSYSFCLIIMSYSSCLILKRIYGVSEIFNRRDLAAAGGTRGTRGACRA